MSRQDLLLGELREFKNHALAEIRELRSEVKDLNKFRWRLMGLSGFATLVSTLIVHIIRK